MPPVVRKAQRCDAITLGDASDLLLVGHAEYLDLLVGRYRDHPRPVAAQRHVAHPLPVPCRHWVALIHVPHKNLFPVAPADKLIAVRHPGDGGDGLRVPPVVADHGARLGGPLRDDVVVAAAQQHLVVGAPRHKRHRVRVPPEGVPHGGFRPGEVPHDDRLVLGGGRELEAAVAELHVPHLVLVVVQQVDGGVGDAVRVRGAVHQQVQPRLGRVVPRALLHLVLEGLAHEGLEPVVGQQDGGRDVAAELLEHPPPLRRRRALPPRVAAQLLGVHEDDEARQRVQHARLHPEGRDVRLEVGDGLLRPPPLQQLQVPLPPRREQALPEALLRYLELRKHRPHLLPVPREHRVVELADSRTVEF
mmetsp:Transcript_20864/g.52329  ORF Transcript_20864/g.52329 Transcript_20864/m.52329 type:complete len:361 (+) Transcript_20864:329-1411(+)